MYRRLLLFLTLLSLPIILFLYSINKPWITASSHTRLHTDFLALSAAICQYQELTGTIPTTSQGFQALITCPAELPENAKWQPMLSYLPKDPWGNTYQYTAFPDENPPRAQILSLGPDRIKSSDDFLHQETFPKP